MKVKLKTAIGVLGRSGEVISVGRNLGLGLIRRGQAMIHFDRFPKHTGGPWYQLSDGRKVAGKDKAETAEKELKEVRQTKELKETYQTK